MKFYYYTKSTMRAGCAWGGWHDTDSFDTKKELREYCRRKGTTVVKIFTEAQYKEYMEQKEV